jgi:hypothetical protein
MTFEMGLAILFFRKIAGSDRNGRGRIYLLKMALINSWKICISYLIFFMRVFGEVLPRIRLEAKADFLAQSHVGSLLIFGD